MASGCLDRTSRLSPCGVREDIFTSLGSRSLYGGRTLSPDRCDYEAGMCCWPIVVAATSAVSCAIKFSLAGSLTTCRITVSSYVPHSSAAVIVLADEEVRGDWSEESCALRIAPKLTLLDDE